MTHHGRKSFQQLLFACLWMLLGTFLCAYALEVFLVPNEIIDGGIVGISLLIQKMLGTHILYPLVITINLPFVYLAFKNLSKSLLILMVVGLAMFAAFGSLIHANDHLPYFRPYSGDLLEIVVVGGLLLGLGAGIVIRVGGCLDGTEILALLINKKYGISVGTVIMAGNILIFASSGLIFGDWHPPIKSLITFFVVVKIMDMVIVGLDEMKSVMIFSSKSEEIAKTIMHEMGLGLTFLDARGGFTGEKRDVIYLMAERLQLSDLKSIVQEIDPYAFIAIENLHEVTSSNGKAVARKDAPA